ncbi:alpha/beta hydrolase [Nocardia sp. NBC_01377]|uniref:alpha/beta hydrolase n=1 Tax=Nocardia sp. NBC_01377 TaxID=2903595 RepID=UPI0032509D98
MTSNIDIDPPQGLRRLDPALVPIARSLPVHGFRSDSLAAERKSIEAGETKRAAETDETGVAIEHRRIVGPLGDALRLRVYRGGGDGPLPVVLYAHGGGFVSGSLDTDHASCVELARDVGCAVVSVEYRLAPEHPCPAALDDVEAAFHDVLQHAEDLGLDRHRLAVMGRDAGAALVAGLVHRVFDANGPRIVLQILHHPMLDCDETLSRSAFPRTPGLGGAAVGRGWAHYLGHTRASARSVPSYRSNLEGLPSAFVACAEVDPCRDEAIDYATRLLRARVPTDLHVLSGTFHGFDSVAPDWEVSAGVRRLHAQVLARAFHAWSGYERSDGVGATGSDDPGSAASPRVV